MSEIEKLVRAFIVEVLLVKEKQSVVKVATRSKAVAKLRVKAQEAFPLVLELFETFEHAKSDDELRTRDALAALMRQLGAVLRVQIPDYRLDEWHRWVGWGRQVFRHISLARK